MPIRSINSLGIPVHHSGYLNTYESATTKQNDP